MWAIAALTAVGLAAALVTQYAFGMQPCAWCILQRFLMVAVALGALVSATLPHGPYLSSGRVSAAFVVMISAAGATAALWQHFVAAASDSCALTFADKFMRGTRLPDVMPSVFGVKGSCADASVPLAYIPYPFWSLGLFILCGALAWRAILTEPD
jgi:disulfide bond formation protein DsbB